MKTMQSQKIVVKLAKNNIKEFDVNAELFEDPYLEAATRAFDDVDQNIEILPRLLTECWDKKHPKKVIQYNTYKLLINPAKYNVAEKLRQKILIQNNCDLAKQPLHD